MCVLMHMCVQTNECVRASELLGAGGALLALGVPADGESKVLRPFPALGALVYATRKIHFVHLHTIPH